ncbi:MAG: hypothetical protein ACOC41_00355 [Chitinivibrionales bacterium]
MIHTKILLNALAKSLQCAAFIDTTSNRPQEVFTAYWGRCRGEIPTNGHSNPFGAVIIRIKRLFLD